MRVLIVKASALGDVVHALPVLSWLKSVEPAPEIDWLVEKPFAPILEGHPLIRKVFHLETKAWRKKGWGETLLASLRLARLLRQEKYDLVLDLQGNIKSAICSLASGAPLRYGFDRDAVREWPNLLASNRKVRLTAEDFHITDRSIAVARAAFPAGKSKVTAGPLSVKEDSKQNIEKLVEETGATAPLIVLHYGTTWDTKLWALRNWKELALRLCKEIGVRPVLTWGNAAEHSAAESILEATNGSAIVWPKGSLGDLVALLQRADLVVGGDTGPIHIAAAAGTATLSFFRVTDATRNGPRGEGHVNLQVSLDCSPCLRKECDRDRECSESITVDEAFQSIQGLLKERH